MSLAVELERWLNMWSDHNILLLVWSPKNIILCQHVWRSVGFFFTYSSLLIYILTVTFQCQFLLTIYDHWEQKCPCIMMVMNCQKKKNDHERSLSVGQISIGPTFQEKSDILFADLLYYFSVIFWVRLRSLDLSWVRSSFWVRSNQMAYIRRSYIRRMTWLYSSKVETIRPYSKYHWK